MRAVVNHAREHIIHGVFRGVHGCREPGYYKRGVWRARLHTIILSAGAVVMINVGLAQARPAKAR